ncbi:MAG: hypothetical protein AB7E05_14850 [Sphingobium sp.]
MNGRFRVACWGTGGVGKACLKEAMRLPEIEVVATLVYSEAKDGQDIGEITGLPAYGVKATRDREAVFATRPDAILYTPMDLGDWRTDDEICELLRRGFNVITSMPYQNLDVREPEVGKAIAQACLDGGSTFHAAGVNPGFIVERLALAATGGTNAITEIKVEEFVRIGTEPEETLKAFGFGIPPSPVAEKTPAAQIAENYERQFIYFLGEAFGTPVKELRYTVDQRLAPRDLPAPTMTLPEGSVAYVSHRWEGITDGPSIVFYTYWYMSDAVMPDTPVPCEDYYVITIEGRPSMRIGVELRASIADYRRTAPGDTTVPVFYVTAVTMVQAIPSVIAASPGIKPIDTPSNGHWKADMRG